MLCSTITILVLGNSSAVNALCNVCEYAMTINTSHIIEAEESPYMDSVEQRRTKGVLATLSCEGAPRQTVCRKLCRQPAWMEIVAQL